MATTQVWLSNGQEVRVDLTLGELQAKLNENSGLPVVVPRVGGLEFLVNPAQVTHALQTGR
jgi:hypothetical protein